MFLSAKTSQPSLNSRKDIDIGGLDVLAAPPRKRSACLACLPEYHRPITCCAKPKQYIRKKNPDGVLHALDPAIALGILGNIHLPKYTKRDDVAQPDKRVNVEEEPRLNQRQHEDERGERPEGTAYDRPDPFRVDVFVLLPRVVEVRGVQADDDEAEDKLEETKYDADEAADCEMRPEGRAGCGLFALERST